MLRPPDLWPSKYWHTSLLQFTPPNSFSLNILLLTKLTTILAVWNDCNMFLMQHSSCITLLNIDLLLEPLPGTKHYVADLTASLFFCKSSFLTRLTNFYKTFGQTLVYGISSFSDWIFFCPVFIQFHNSFQSIYKTYWGTKEYNK